VDRTRSGSTLFLPLLIVVCVCAAALSLNFFIQVRSAENNSKRERAVLIQEKDALSKEKDALTGEKDTLVKEKDILIKDRDAAIKERDSFKGEVDTLKGNLKAYTRALTTRLEDSMKAVDNASENIVLDKYTPSQLITLISSREMNLSAKKLLQDTAKKLETVMSGKAVTLEPIVVNAGPIFYDQKQGQVLSVDAANKLIVLDQGSFDVGNKEQNCTVYDGDEAICEASVVSMPSAMSVLRIKNFYSGQSIKDVKKGLKVILE
jgi:hypothetical protein